MKTYLPLITNMPLFFIHGKNDLLVPYLHFEAMYQATNNTACCAPITPYEHILNHLKGKEVYAYMVDRFIAAKSVESFIELLNK